MKKVLTLAAAILGASATLLPASASAQRTDEWRFGAVLYAYLPDIGGQTTFPPRTGGSGIDVDASTILSHLKFTFMGSFEAQKGRWGAFTDVVYMDVGDNKSQTRDLTIGGVTLPVGVTADVNFDLKGTVWTIAGSYRAATEATNTVDVFAGARMLTLKETLGWNFSADLPAINNPGRSGGSEIKTTNWDAIVGAKGRVAFGDRNAWFVPWYLDVGTGDSHLTWQGIGGLGYAFSWGEVIAAWRYLDYDFKSGSKVEKIDFSGPAIGVAFRWK